MPDSAHDTAAAPDEPCVSTLADTVSLLQSENAVLSARVTVLEAQIERILSRSALVCSLVLAAVGVPFPVGNAAAPHARPEPQRLRSSANAGPSEQLQRMGEDT